MAYLCRYGHQSIFALLGKPPPLEPDELHLFTWALKHHLDREFPEEETGKHRNEED